MNVFDFRDRLVADYSAYVTSFISIRDPRIRERVDQDLAEGLLWPEPSIGLNPSFAKGGWIDDLVAEGVLHSECGRIFRVNKNNDNAGSRLRLHRHQLDAIHAARAGRNYVLTTGTGSGKSLAYIVPIVDAVLRGPRRARHQSNRRLSNERPGEQPRAGASEVPHLWLPGWTRTGDVPALHGPRERRRAACDSRRSAGHPAHETAKTRRCAEASSEQLPHS